MNSHRVSRRAVVAGLASSLGMLVAGPRLPGLAREAAAQPDGRAEWNRLLEAAKREGRVAVAGAPSVEFRAALSAAFQKAYPESSASTPG